eukprot:c9478_g1_i1 orf=96-587(+)
MESDPNRDKSRKRRKSSQAFEEKVGRKKAEEADNHVLAAVEESTEKCEAEDSEQQQRELLLQSGEDPEKGALPERAMSAEMEANIQEIRQKVQQFTQQVSGLLEGVKTFFAETSNAFEERLVLLHQAQIDKWEEEIKLLETIDSENEDINFRLSNAQELLSTI